MSAEWLEPWWPTDAWTDDQREGFARQLKLEVGPDHPLFNVPARVVGRHGGCDDALFQLLDGSGRFAVVHLTWARSQEPMPWPGHEIFDSFDAFAATRMQEDNDEYNL